MTPHTFPPIPQLVEQLLQKALEKGASDLHLESFPEGLLVRYRIDGLLSEEDSFPLSLREPILNRLKIMATNLNLSEKRIPQDGRFTWKNGTKKIEIRLSSLPTLQGESIVLRFLDPSMLGKPLQELGLFPEQLPLLKQLLAHRDGLLLITGPTGSGKTTTLYAALQALQNSHTKIVTIEDPIEYHLPTITQVQVDPKLGLDFSTILRASLRHAIDKLIIGEIRDRETAQSALQASLTGHFILSTLHTNTALEAPLRLQELGVTPYFLSQGIVAIISQRLLRQLCPHCRRASKSPPNWKSLVPKTSLLHQQYQQHHYLKATIMEAPGCHHCDQTGFFGRQALLEIIPFTEEIRSALAAQQPLSQIARYLNQQQIPTLRELGIRSLLSGKTTLSEVAAQTPEPYST